MRLDLEALSLTLSPTLRPAEFNELGKMRGAQ